jgi:hypothetical protein
MPTRTPISQKPGGRRGQAITSRTGEPIAKPRPTPEPRPKPLVQGRARKRPRKGLTALGVEFRKFCLHTLTRIHRRSYIRLHAFTTVAAPA